MALGLFVAFAAIGQRPEQRVDWHRAEVIRIQEHLTGAEQLLLGADTAHLTSEQRLARETNIKVLQAYRDNGVFPRNLDFQWKRMPYFVDDRGVRCAMAELIASSGRIDLVDRVQRTQNNAFVRELASDVELASWLEASGLSVEEAARVQPGYGNFFESYSSTISPEFAMASAAANALSGASIALNLAANPSKVWHGAFGVVAGGLTVALGAAKVDDRGDSEKLAIWNIAVGTLAIGFGGYTLFTSGESEETHSLGQQTPSARGRTLQLNPFAGVASGLQLVWGF